MGAFAWLIESASHRHEEAIEDVELIGVRADLTVRVRAVRYVHRIIMANSLHRIQRRGLGMQACASSSSIT